MSNEAWTRPQRVAPTLEVSQQIIAEMESRRYTVMDRRTAAGAADLVAEPVGVPGLNEGIFYPPDALPVHALGLSPSRAVRARSTTGVARCLVLLVDFPDNVGTRDPAQFDAMLFSKGTYPTGSMRDYYRESSYGKYDLEGKVVGWLRLPQPYSYYVDGQNGLAANAYPHDARKLVEDALALAALQVDFSTFDADGDGYLDGLFIVHAGGGAEADPNPASRAGKIWSHQWNITSPFVSAGVTAYAYSMEPEDGRVGVFAHEFGHMLGLPDLYDTTYRSEGAGDWCLMAGGSWNGGGDTPAEMSAWAKARLGWLVPQIVKRSRTLRIVPIEHSDKACYRLWTKGATGDEYFLLEYRQRTGFDAKLPGEGLLIWHIDDDEHNNDHPGDYLVGLEQADGRTDLELNRNRGDSGDPYPGNTHKSRFDAVTDPNSNDELGHPTAVAVTSIAISAGAITCKAKV